MIVHIFLWLLTIVTCSAMERANLNLSAILDSESPLISPRASSRPASPRFGPCSHCLQQEQIHKLFDCIHQFCARCAQQEARRECPQCQQAARACPVCLDVLIPDQATSLICNHYFCKVCISEWNKGHTTCPVCRRMIDYKDAHSCEVCKRTFWYDDEIESLLCEGWLANATHLVHDTCHNQHIAKTVIMEEAGDLKYTCPVHHGTPRTLRKVEGQDPVVGIRPGDEPEGKITRSKTARELSVANNENVKCGICKKSFMESDPVSIQACGHQTGMNEIYYYHDRCYSEHIRTRMYQRFCPDKLGWGWVYPCPIHPHLEFHVPIQVEVTS